MRYIRWAFLVLILWQLSHFCQEKTARFTLLRTQSTFSYHPEWETNDYDRYEVKEALAQKFTYLAQGGQSFVFVSEDHKYVLKLFKLDRRSMPYQFSSWPLPSFARNYFKKKEQKLASKLERDFTSYQIAFDELKEESGLVLVHLNKTHEPHLKTTIIDPLNIAHHLDLSKMEFILQRKAEGIYPYLDNLLENQEIDKAKSLIDGIITSVIHRSKKGILDEDAVIHRNFGVLDGKVIFIDIGRFVKDQARTCKEAYLYDLSCITKKLHDRLPRDLADYLTTRLDEEKN